MQCGVRRIDFPIFNEGEARHVMDHIRHLDDSVAAGIGRWSGDWCVHSYFAGAGHRGPVDPGYPGPQSDLTGRTTNEPNDSRMIQPRMKHGLNTDPEVEDVFINCV